MTEELLPTPDAVVRTGTEHVLARRIGGLGHLTLNRPRSLNALNAPMVHGIRRALRVWATDPQVATVLLDAAPGRAFCAGGDVTAVRTSAATDGGRSARMFWRAEYALDLRIAQYPKPVVSVLDGLVLGGGVGLTVHRRYRVVTERTQFAMPEVAIGLSPDVGALLVLAHLPHELGTHLALTGTRLGPAELLALGLADQYLPSSARPELVRHLIDSDAETALAQTALARSVGNGSGAPAAPAWPEWIERCYQGDDLRMIVNRLAAESDPAARSAAATIRAGSPTAAAVTLAALRRAASMTTLAECLRMDYTLVCRFLDHPDLSEGIRAAVVDKDRQPQWRPAELDGVDATMVVRFFEALPAGGQSIA